MDDVRAALTAPGRVVVKVGSSSLTGSDGYLDEAALVSLVDVLAGMRSRGQQVVLVTSGSIAAGLVPLGLGARPTDLATAQATASVGQVLLTADDLTRRAHYGNAQRALDRLLELGVVPIVNENDTVATDEIRFGDNDRLAALVATVVHADALVLLTDVDGLYTAAPGTPGARRIERVAAFDEIEGVDISQRGHSLGTGGMVTKLEAARIATGSGVAVVLAAARDAEAAVTGADVGTIFAPTGKRSTNRLQWLAHAAKMRGQLVLDEGAVKAVRGGKASLLAAGVRAVRGEFEAGDPVELVGPDGTAVARGFARFAAHQIPSMMGLSTAAIRSTLGEEYARELVHLDDLVVIANGK